MATQLSQPTLFFGALCAIASIPFIFESLPGKTQTPVTPTSSPAPSSTAVPTPNPAAIPTLTPGTAPVTPTPAAPAIPQPTPPSPDSEPTPTLSPEPQPSLTPVSPPPTPQTGPEPAPTTPAPSPTPPAAGNSLSQYSASSAPRLTVGSQGQAVKDVQSFLRAAGIYSGPIDGVYGLQTQAAVESFQESKNLTSDGVVGPQTWAAMLGS